MHTQRPLFSLRLVFLVSGNGGDGLAGLGTEVRGACAFTQPHSQPDRSPVFYPLLERPRFRPALVDAEEAGRFPVDASSAPLCDEESSQCCYACCEVKRANQGGAHGTEEGQVATEGEKGRGPAGQQDFRWRAAARRREGSWP
eukprot:1393693-Rhodomonas_salina.1